MANVTIKHVADLLGIAHSTVSRALRDDPHTSEQTKERVRRAAEKLGYVPHAAARALRADTGLLIGLVLPNVELDAFGTAAQILSRRCMKAGLQVMLALSEDDPQTEYAQALALRAARVRGIVIAPCSNPLSKTVALLQSVPTVQYARHHASFDAPWISVDGGGGVATATQHLLQIGHRRIAYLGPDPQLSTGAERLAGFISATRKGRAPADPSLRLFGPMETEVVRATVTGMLRLRNRPTALVFGSGGLMPGALAAVRDACMQVPRDLSVVGYGNPGWYQVWGPGITTIEQPFAEMANAAASQLLHRVINNDSSHPSDVVHLKLKPAFILRGSTGPPNARGD